MTKSVDKYPIYDPWEQPAPHMPGNRIISSKIINNQPDVKPGG